VQELKDSKANCAIQLMRIDDLDGAARIVENELGACEDRGTSKSVWSLRLIRADLTRLRGFTEQALTYLTSRRSEFPPEEDDLASLAAIDSYSGYYMGLFGRYPSAHLLMSRAEEIARFADLHEIVCEVQQRQAMIFYLQHDYASSDRIFRLILDSSRQIGGWYFRANAQWGIGKNLMIQGHHSEALPWLDDACALFAGAGVRQSVATVWSEMAVCHLGLGDDVTSLRLLKDALEANREAGTVQNYQVVLANIGNVYLHRGDNLTAATYYRRALDVAREIKDPVSVEKWTYNIRLAYARLRQSVDRLDSHAT